MASYNGAKYIKEQIASILIQLEEQDELVISDDGSTDETLDIINSFKDKRIKLIKHKHPEHIGGCYKSNVYVSSNFENALGYCSGEFIFLTDQDDVWVEGKVKKMVQFAEANPVAGVVMSAITVIRSDGSIKKTLVVPRDVSFLKGLLIAKYLGSSMMLTRKFLEVALPFPRGIVSHDAWLGALAKYNKALFVMDEPLLLYRRHSENVTSKAIRTPFFKKIKYRIIIFINILIRSRLCGIKFMQIY